MSRKKEKDWVYAHFSFDKEVKEKLIKLKDFEGMSQTEFMEFLINNWEQGVDPTAKLIHLTKEREKLQEQLKILDEGIKSTTNQIKLFDDWRKIKKVRKVDAIKIIERKILDGELEEAERAAKAWQRLTGIPAVELLLESKEGIEKKGI